MTGKKPYRTPLLIRHGEVESVTRHGGANFVDVPIGTPVDGDVSNVAVS